MILQPAWQEGIPAAAAGTNLGLDSEVPAAHIMRVGLGVLIVAVVLREVHDLRSQAAGRARVHLVARAHQLLRDRQVVLLAGRPRVHPVHVAQRQQACRGESHNPLQYHPSGPPEPEPLGHP